MDLRVTAFLDIYALPQLIDRDTKIGCVQMPI